MDWRGTAARALKSLLSDTLFLLSYAQKVLNSPFQENWPTQAINISSNLRIFCLYSLHSTYILKNSSLNMQLRSNSPIVSLPAQMQVGSNQGHMGSTNHGQGGQRPGIQSQEQLQRLIADPEVKPNERALLQQLFELRRRRPIAEAAQRQATVSHTSWDGQLGASPTTFLKTVLT